jgi:hypothetical protein
VAAGGNRGHGLIVVGGKTAADDGDGNQTTGQLAHPDVVVHDSILSMLNSGFQIPALTPLY